MKTKYGCTVLTKTPKVVMPPKPFIAKVSITTPSYLLRIPFYGNADISVDWGDGSKDSYSGYIESPSHTYDLPDDYIITIQGNVEGMATVYSGSSGYITLDNSWCNNLISIIQWGELGLTNAISACYQCTNLVSIPDTPFGNPNITTAFGMFQECSSLISIPAGLFKYNTEVTDFGNTFYGCTSLTEIPAGLFDNNKKALTFTQTFYRCILLNGSIPSGLFANNKEVTNFQSIFYQCINLTEIPVGLFDTNTAVTTFYGIFQGCINLTGIPPGLFANNIVVTSFDRAFYGCSGLTGYTPTDSYGELWDRPGVTGSYCFYICTGLSNYGAAVSAGWT